MSGGATYLKIWVQTNYWYKFNTGMQLNAFEAMLRQVSIFLVWAKKSAVDSCHLYKIKTKIASTKLIK